MAAASVQNDREGVRRCECGAVAQADDPRREWRDMLPEYDGGSAEALEEAVVNHGSSSSPQLLCWLEHGHESARPAAGICRQGRAGTEQAGDVYVMSAGMHDRHLPAAVRHGTSHARVRQPGLLLDREGVHVRAQQNDRAVSVAEQTDHTGSTDTGDHLESGP